MTPAAALSDPRTPPPSPAGAACAVRVRRTSATNIDAHTELLRNAAACAPELSRVLQAGSLLLSTVEAALHGPVDLHDPVAQRRLRDDLLLHLVDAMAGAERADEVHRADARKRVVDSACELMLADPDAPPTLLEVCNRVGASPRKLGYCFQDVLGLSPARYVKAVRLNAVRRELRSVSAPDTSVYDVAARWGFWHFGHFSSDDKRLFSELPSDTLRRNGGRRRQ